MKIGFAQINPTVGDLRGNCIGVTICEDIWTERYLPRPFYDVDLLRALVTQEAEMILNVSASPFSLRKPAVRREMISGLAGTYQRPIFYCNAVGGNDQLVFDGNSIAVNARGQLLAQLPAFEEASVIVDSESVQSDRKSTRLNSSHVAISYAVFCLKKK